MSDDFTKYDAIFVESIVEEINEILVEKYKDEETVPILGVIEKDKLPEDFAIWLKIFKTEDIEEKLDFD